MQRLSLKQTHSLLEEIKPDYSLPNPLLDAYQRINPHRMLSQVKDRWEDQITRARISQLRGALIRAFACGIPTEEAITAIAKAAADGVVSIAAGSGYWEKLIAQYVRVTAYDAYLPGTADSPFMTPWYPVMCADESAVTRHPDCALLLCWPPGANSMAARTLHAYRGRTLIYVGELEGGWHADEEFFRVLRSGWRAIGKVEIPTWPSPKNMTDAVYIFARN